METLDLLADPAVLARKVGQAADDERVTDALKAASGRFRGEVRHHVTRKSQDTLRLDGTGTRTLRLPVAHVQEVHEVTIDGEPVQVRDSPDGLLTRRDGRNWPKAFGAIKVTLTHGLDKVPQDIASVVLAQAETEYWIRRGVSSYQVGGISISQGTQESIGATEAWAAAVEQWRIRVGDRA